MITTTCTACGTILEFDDQYAGQDGQCHCGVVLVVPPSRRPAAIKTRHRLKKVKRRNSDAKAFGITFGIVAVCLGGIGGSIWYTQSPATKRPNPAAGPISNAGGTQAGNKSLQSSKQVEMSKESLQAAYRKIEVEAIKNLPKKRRDLFERDSVASFADFSERFIAGTRSTERFNSVELSGTDVQRTASLASPYLGILEMKTANIGFERLRLLFDGHDGGWTLHGDLIYDPIEGTFRNSYHQLETTWSSAGAIAERYPYNTKEFEQYWK